MPIHTLNTKSYTDKNNKFIIISSNNSQITKKDFTISIIIMMRERIIVNNYTRRNSNISKICTLNNKTCMFNKNSLSWHPPSKTCAPITTTCDRSWAPRWTLRAWTCRILSTQPSPQEPSTSENLPKSHTLTKTVTISMSGHCRMNRISQGYLLADRSSIPLLISSRCFSSRTGTRL